MLLYKVLEGTDDYLIHRSGKLFRHIGNDLVEVLPCFAGEYPTWTIEMAGSFRTVSIHREMAKHFLPNPHSYPVVNHKDGNKFNWALDNLEWTTQQRNVQHAQRHGLCPHTTPTEVVEIIRRYLAQGIPMKEIAKQTGVHYQTVINIKTKKRHHYEGDDK